MYNYYNLDIIPIILDIFKVNNVIISGLDDKLTVEIVLNHCEVNNIQHTAIDSKNNSLNDDYIQDYALNVLPNLSNYDAIFLNDDPNWYTVYNELNIINQNNEEFPLVFICHNVFPHKRRDSYINPNIIPEDFRNEFSKKFDYENISLRDNFYHAIEENTPKNGVLTAIEDFLVENQAIGIMNIKLVNGITILYPKNNISKIRLGKLSDEIQGHDLEFDEISDNIFENKLLTSYVSRLNISNSDLEVIEDIKFELDEKERIINDYEGKIQLHDDELNYKNSQIESIDSKLSLRDNQIKNFESKLVNKDNEIKNFESKLVSKDNEISNLNKELQEVINQINSLKQEITNKNKNFENKERELNTKINDANSKINSLSTAISQKEQIEAELNNQLEIANNQLKTDIEQINHKNNNILDKDNEILIKEKELIDKQRKLDLVKRKYANQLSKLDNKEYCISCYKEEIQNNHSEIQYLKRNTLTRKLFSPFAYIYLIFKSNPKELKLNFKLYKTLKNSQCFDIGFYLNNNEDLLESKWCKVFSPELHYICKGFSEKRKFNKKYYNTHSKKELLEYILKCP